MNIYIEDSETLPAVKLDTSEPSGFTISSNPTVDWDKHCEYLVGDQHITAKGIRDELQGEYDTITWSSGSTAQKDIWSKWFVATKTERDTRHDAAEQKTNFKTLVCLVNQNTVDDYAQQKADSYSTLSPSEIDTQIASQDSDTGQITSKTGSYTGDGAISLSVTEIGFTPKYVKIWVRATTDGANVAVFEAIEEIIDDHASGMSVVHGTGSNEHTVQANTIISLDSDGFTVDDNGADQHPNKSGQVYNYLALK